MRFYHVYTKGLEDRLIFRTTDDFVAGMNYVAIVHFKVRVKLLAFVLMSNHVHFAIGGSEEDVWKFINLYKRLISVYITNKYHDAAFLRRIVTNCDEVSVKDDGLKRLIAYILDNPVNAGVNRVAFAYHWGSATCYFSNKPDKATSISSLSIRAQRHILHSNVMLPDTYLLGPEGYILPHSYVDVQFVENHFGRPKSLEYFLSVSASSRKLRKDVVMFSDDIIRQAMDELLINKYGVPSFHNLEFDLQVNLIRELRSHFNVSAKQIARLTGFKLKDSVKILG